MNTKEFLKILKDPTQLQNEQVFELEDVIRSFPYFQAARVLYLKGLKNQNSFRYNQDLKTTAIHTTDRSVLFHFITSDTFYNSQSKKQELKIIQKIEEVDENVIKNLKKEVTTSEEDKNLILKDTESTTDKVFEGDSNKIEASTDKIHSIQKEKDYITNDIAENLKETEEELQKNKGIEKEEIEYFIKKMTSNPEEYSFIENKDTDDLVIETDEQNVEYIDETSIEKLQKEVAIITHDEEVKFLKEKADKAKQDIDNKSQEATTDKSRKAKGFIFEIDNEEHIYTVETESSNNTNTSKTQDYHIAFELIQDEITTQITEESPVKEEKISIDLDITDPIHFNKDDTYSFSDWMQLSSFKPIDRNKPAKIVIQRGKNMDLIDEFIEKNPKIKPSKIAGFTVNFNQIEEIESDIMMTETLARVYTDQHKYDNAIKAYEILSLKFPEKSSFFADQIKMLENLKQK